MEMNTPCGGGVGGGGVNAAPAEAPKRCSHHGKTKPTESRTGSGAMLRDNAVAFHHQTGPEVELSPDPRCGGQALANPVPAGTGSDANG